MTEVERRSGQDRRKPIILCKHIEDDKYVEITPCSFHTQMPQIILELLENGKEQKVSSQWLLRLTKIYMVILGVVLTVGGGYIGISNNMYVGSMEKLVTKYQVDMIARDKVRFDIIQSVEYVKGQQKRLEDMLLQAAQTAKELHTLVINHIKKWDAAREDELKELRAKQAR